MMGAPAIIAIRLQFEAGPQTHVFCACAEHLPTLVAGDVMCFYRRPQDHPVSIPTLPDDPTPCYFCQEG